MKQRKEKSLHRNKGITLIALVVTIILLLILAGVSIYFVANNGLIDKTMEAADKQDKATVKEAVALRRGEAYFDEYQRGITANEYFIEKGYMDAAGVINVEKTVGSELKSGKGTDNKDVYKIEELDLVYYSPEGTREVLAEKIMGGAINAKIEYEFDAATGTITGIKNKQDYYDIKGTISGIEWHGWGYAILPQTEIVVPSQINGVEVKAIKCKYGGRSGVFNNTNITKITIPETVTQIGGDITSEFMSCSDLKEVVIESPNISITGGETFASSTLEKITFTNITEANAPAGSPWGAPSSCIIQYKKPAPIEYEFDASTGTITGIKNKQDYYSKKGTISGIEWTGWSNCVLPDTEIVIPSQINGVEVKAIKCKYGGRSGVFNNTNITKITIPETVTQIGGDLSSEFMNCPNLKEVVIESPNINITGGETFAICNNLQKITFTNIVEANAPAGSPWGAPSGCIIQYK